MHNWTKSNPLPNSDGLVYWPNFGRITCRSNTNPIHRTVSPSWDEHVWRYPIRNLDRSRPGRPRCSISPTNCGYLGTALCLRSTKSGRISPLSPKELACIFRRDISPSVRWEKRGWIGLSRILGVNEARRNYKSDAFIMIKMTK